MGAEPADVSMRSRHEQGRRPRRTERRSRGHDRSGIAGVLALLAGAVLLVTYGHYALPEAAAGKPVGSNPVLFWSVVAVFVVAVAIAIGCEAARLIERVTGPERRLCQALRRIRAGDLGFRITLRRGDLLHEVARECNELLDWLNANPPPGSRRGSDVYEVPVEEEERVAP